MTKKFEPGDLVKANSTDFDAYGVVVGQKYAHGPTVHWLTVKHESLALAPMRTGDPVRNHAAGMLVKISDAELPCPLDDEAHVLIMKVRLLS